MSRKKYILYIRWISVEILLTFRKVKVGKLIFVIDKPTIFDTVVSTILIELPLSKGVVDGESL